MTSNSAKAPCHAFYITLLHMNVNKIDIKIVCTSRERERERKKCAIIIKEPQRCERKRTRKIVH